MESGLPTYPIASMYGIFTYIYHKNQLNVGKDTSPMDGIGTNSPCSKLRPFLWESVFPLLEHIFTARSAEVICPKEMVSLVSFNDIFINH